MSKKPKRSKGRRNRNEEERTGSLKPKRNKEKRNREEKEKRKGSFFSRKFVVLSTIAAIFFGFVVYQKFTTGFSEENLLKARIANEEKPLVAMDFSVDTINGKYVYSENKGKTLVYFFSFPG